VRRSPAGLAPPEPRLAAALRQFAEPRRCPVWSSTRTQQDKDTMRGARMPAALHTRDGCVVVDVTAAAPKPSDRLMAPGVFCAHSLLAAVAGLDGQDRLQDGFRTASDADPVVRSPAEPALLPGGQWAAVLDCVVDLVAAAFMSPGMAHLENNPLGGRGCAGPTRAGPSSMPRSENRQLREARADRPPRPVRYRGLTAMLRAVRSRRAALGTASHGPACSSEHCQQQ
jgi:hypothetical protein